MVLNHWEINTGRPDGCFVALTHLLSPPKYTAATAGSDSENDKNAIK